MAIIRKAAANPTKAFFVRMLTRDITLEDCILDLIDNSIDGAWEQSGGHPLNLSNKTKLDDFDIDITIDRNSFSIQDNCGGITLDDAADYAFTFGRRNDAKKEDYSIGIYGIGMKRAVFKLGKRITIRSTFSDNEGNQQSFKVVIDTEKWLSAPTEQSWDFDIEDDEPLPAPGVRIEVEDLNDGAVAAFSDPAFLNNLRHVISRDYALHLARGISISTNQKVIEGWAIQFRSGGDFSPMRTIAKPEGEGGAVQMEIIAGMLAPPPDYADPDEKRETEARSGWYVICNGRIVVAADKSTLTGWGTDNWPKWHPQYSGFLGIVIFASQDAAELPLTTTKRSIDGTQPLYRSALPTMRKASKAWTSYTNSRKPDLDKAKQKENETKPVSIFEVKRKSEISLPVFEKKKIKSDEIANIAYPMPLKRVRELARALGYVGLSYREVGVRSFEYAYDELVGED